MARAPPPQARRPIAPLAFAATVVPASPAVLASPAVPAALAPFPARRRQSPAQVGAIVLALAAGAAAVALNSPLAEALGVGGAWRFLGFWAELGCVLAVLGMVFRQPALAWSGAGVFFGFSLFMAQWVWPGHLVSLLLLAAVAVWNLGPAARPPPAPPPGGWVPLQ